MVNNETRGFDNTVYLKKIQFELVTICQQKTEVENGSQNEIRCRKVINNNVSWGQTRENKIGESVRTLRIQQYIY